MELKVGYKNTEVGLIPSDWEVKPLGEIAFVNMGQSPLSTYYNSQGIGLPLVQGNADVENRKTIIRFYTSMITKRGKIGDIIMSVRAPVGEVSKATFECCLGRGVCSISFDNEYIYQYLIFFEKSWAKLSTGSTFDSVNSKQVKELQIPLPPTKAEQTAIATALSDADALISSLSTLIAKKRYIKQGAMQKLLQPKDGWEVKPFKDLCWFQEGPGLRNWQFTTRGIKVINVTNLANGILNLDRTDRHISLEEFHKMYEHFEIEENDIVVASSGNSYGKVAVVRKKDLPLLMNTSVIRFKPLKELDYNFLLTYLKSNQFKNQIDLLITGGAQPNFGPVHLNKISINLPPTKEEQTRIATILLDMENEILALETKLEKYKKVKLGMMQNLLTGKIRLIVNG